MADQEVKIKLTVDASQAKPAVDDLKKTINSIGGGNSGGGSSGGGGGVSLRQIFGEQTIGSINKTNTAVKAFSGSVREMSKFTDAHSNSVSKLSGEYKRYGELLKAANVAGSTQDAKKYEAQLVSTAKKLKDNSANQAEYNKNLKTYNETVAKANSSARARGDKSSPYSEPTKRQALNQQLSGFALMGLGNLINKAGGYAQAANSQYGSLNNQYRFDTGLTDSQRSLARSRLQLGGNLSGIEQLKNNIEASVNSSPFGVPAAIASQLAPLAGGALQAAGVAKSLGLLGNGAKAASGAAGAATAIEETGVAARLAAGGAAVGGGEAGAAAIGGGGLFAGLSGIGLGGAALLGGSAIAGGLLGNVAGNLLTGGNGFGQGGKTLDNWLNPEKAGMAQQEQNLASNKDFQKKITQLTPQERADAVKAYNNINDAFSQLKQINESGMGDDAKKKAREDILNQNQQLFSDHGIDTGEVKRNQEDNNKISQMQGQVDMTKADVQAGKLLTVSQAQAALITASPQFQMQQKQVANQVADFNYSQAQQTYELNKGYTRGQEDRTRQAGYIQQDYQFQEQGFQIQTQRAGEDTARAVQDRQIQMYRTVRDVQTNIADLEQDTAKQRQRTLEDSSREELRLTQNTQRELSRSREDFTRESAKQDTDYNRTQSDLKTGLGDSLVGIMAPSLANNKAFQVGKLLRDYQKNSSRATEDYQYNKTSLQIGENRTEEDAARQLSQGTEDIERNKKRSLQDTATSEQRGIRNANRTLADAQQDNVRALELINQQYSREMQDIGRAQQQASVQYTRSLDQLSLEQTRAAQDLADGMKQIAHNGQNFNRDMGMSKEQQIQDLMNQGLSRADAEKALSGYAGIGPDTGNTPFSGSASSGGGNSGISIGAGLFGSGSNALGSNGGGGIGPTGFGSTSATYGPAAFGSGYGAANGGSTYGGISGGISPKGFDTGFTPLGSGGGVGPFSKREAASDLFGSTVDTNLFSDAANQLRDPITGARIPFNPSILGGGGDVPDEIGSMFDSQGHPIFGLGNERGRKSPNSGTNWGGLFGGGIGSSGSYPIIPLPSFPSGGSNGGGKSSGNININVTMSFSDPRLKAQIDAATEAYGNSVMNIVRAYK